MSQATAIQQSNRKRSRHWAYLEAHALTQQGAFSLDDPNFYENAWGQAPEIERLAGFYKRDVGDKAIVLSSECDERVLVLPYYTRFSEGYYPEKAREIRRSVKFDDAVLLTLTDDPRRRSCLLDAKNALMYGWADLRNVMNKDVERGSGHVVGWSGKYLGVLEFQQSGNPHLHIVLEGCRWVDVEWLRNLWESRYGVGTFVNVERIRGNRKKVVNYVLKYLFKAKDNERHLSLLWALNARAFTCSRSIFNNSKTNCDKSGGPSECQWSFVGVYPLDICRGITTKAEMFLVLFPGG